MWLLAVVALHKRSKWSQHAARLVAAIYFVIGVIGLVRFDFIRYEFGSLVLLVLGSWLVIWVVAQEQRVPTRRVWQEQVRTGNLLHEHSSPLRRPTLGDQRMTLSFRPKSPLRCSRYRARSV